MPGAPPDDSADPALEQAMDWLLLLQDPDTGADIRRRFDAWLAADPDHGRAWAQARRAWGLLGELSPARPAATVPSRRRRNGLVAAAAALAACLAVAMLFPAAWPRLMADHATATAELRRLTLTDGSIVHLGPDSALDVAYTADRRAVTLRAGRAFFEVVSDAARPFTVAAGEVDVTVLGTAFEIRRGDDATTVAVERGSVAVRAAGVRPPLDVRLGPGERVAVRRDGIRRDQVAAGDIAAWRAGRLFLDGATVAEVAAEIGAYRPGWIVIADPALGRRRVTGLYDLRQPDRALRALVQPVGGQVTEVTPLLRVLSAP